MTPAEQGEQAARIDRREDERRGDFCVSDGQGGKRSDGSGHWCRQHSLPLSRCALTPNGADPDADDALAELRAELVAAKAQRDEDLEAIRDLRQLIRERAKIIERRSMRIAEFRAAAYVLRSGYATAAGEAKAKRALRLLVNEGGMMPSWGGALALVERILARGRQAPPRSPVVGAGLPD